MNEWVLVATDKYETMQRQYEKGGHRHNALLAAGYNLESFFALIRKGSHPQFINGSYIHDEGGGLIALDQRGPGRRRLKREHGINVKLEETRLYFYPDLETKTIYLLTIGSKNTQRADIKMCKQYIKTQIRGQR